MKGRTKALLACFGAIVLFSTLLFGGHWFRYQTAFGFTVKHSVVLLLNPKAYLRLRQTMYEELASIEARLPVDALEFLRTVEIRTVPFSGYLGYYQYSGEPGTPGFVTINFEVEVYDFGVLIHELAHAYHDVALRGRDDGRVVEAFRLARGNPYYRYIDEYGRAQSAYALLNAEEYFAEISTAYFYGKNDQPPRNKAELRKNDPTGYLLVEALWRVHES